MLLMTQEILDLECNRKNEKFMKAVAEGIFQVGKETPIGCSKKKKGAKSIAGLSGSDCCGEECPKSTAPECLGNWTCTLCHCICVPTPAV